MSENMQDSELWVIFMHSAMTMSPPQEATEYADTALRYYKERWGDSEQIRGRETYDEKAAYNDD